MALGRVPRAPTPGKRGHPSTLLLPFIPSICRVLRPLTLCFNIGAHDLPISSLVEGSSDSAVPRCGAWRICGSVWGTGKRRHHAPASNRDIFLYFRAAGVSARVSRVRSARPRRQDLRLVRDWPAVADAASRHHRNIHRKATDL